MPRPSVREKLVETALEQFQDLGFNACGVQDITDVAGVPKGSFYNHFKSKEALAIEVLHRYVDGTGCEMLLVDSGSPLARLRAHFEFLADRMEGWHFQRGCLLGNFATETSDASVAMRGVMDEAFAAWSAKVARVLQQAQERGEIDPRFDPDTLARFLIDAWEGAVIRAKVAKRRAALDDFFEVAFGTLLARPVVA